MRQVSLITLVSVFALFMGGCQGGEQTTEVTPTPVPVASAISPTPSSAASPFDKPLTTQQPGKNTAVAGLIQSLPPEARVRQISKGRTDPFASLPQQPIVTVSPNPQAGGAPATRPVPDLPRLQPPKGQGGGRINRPGTPGGNALPKPRTAPRSNNPKMINPRLVRPPLGIPGIPGPNLLPPLIKPPEPTLAKGIEVTGVVEVGGVSRAIVKVPNEPSRSVQAGQRISNGQVLVKRIEMNRGPTPVVILEQNGVEVAKGVGEKPTGTPGQPTASLPPPPPTTI